MYQKKKINVCYGEKIDVVIPNIDVKGTGRNTLALVAYTEKFVNYSNKQYEIKMIIMMYNLMMRLGIVVIMFYGQILILNYGFFYILER